MRTSARRAPFSPQETSLSRVTRTSRLWTSMSARLSKRMITFNTVSPSISDGLVSCWTTSQPCYYWYDRYITRDQAEMRMENAKVTMRSAGCLTGQARIDSIIMCMSISVMLMILSSQEVFVCACHRFAQNGCARCLATCLPPHRICVASHSDNPPTPV